MNGKGPADGRSASERNKGTETDPDDTNEQTAGTPLLAVTGDHAVIEGDFKVADSLRIECEVGGTLDVGGTVVIGESGKVHANVQTVDALILGTYEGDMVATGEVEIAASGRVVGSVRTDSLVINKGGFFNGSVEAINDKPAAASEPDGNGAEPRTAKPAAIAGGNDRASENGSGTHAAEDREDQPEAEEDGADTAFLGQSAEAVAANA